MNTQSTQEPPMDTLEWKEHLEQRAYQMILHNTASDSGIPALPTAGQQKFVILGFILGVLSIFCGFFPICGLPIGLSGLIIGLVGRRYIRSLYRIATWTTLFSTIGLTLALLNIAISVGIYISIYLLR